MDSQDKLASSSSLSRFLLLSSLLFALAPLSAWGQSHPPIVCSANEEITLRNQVIDTAGNAIVASGSCEIKIYKSEIRAGGYAIVASGSAEVDIWDSTIEGRLGGLVSLQNSEIGYNDTVVRGGVSTAQSGDLDDNGGNQVSGTVARLPTSADLTGSGSVTVSESSVRLPGVEVDAGGVRVGGVTVDANGVSVGGAVSVDSGGVRVGGGPSIKSLEAGGPVRCDRSGRMVVENRLIETDGDGVAVLANCDVTIRSSRIVAGSYGVLLTANGTVTVEDSYVEGALGGLMLTGNGTIRYRNTVVIGGATSTAKGRLDDLGGNEVSGRGDPSGLGRSIDRGAGRGSTGADLRSDDIRIDANGVRVGNDIRIDGGGITVGDIVIGPSSIRIGQDEISIQSVGDYVRLDVGGTAVDSGWRQRHSSWTAADTLRLLDAFDARVEGGVTHLDLTGDVLFDFGSAAIRNDAATELGKLAHVLRAQAKEEVLVIGHTDSVGSETDNQKLSEARAVAVMQFLNAREGIPAQLMRGRGLGETKPIAHNTMPDGSDNPAGRARNRRVEITYR